MEKTAAGKENNAIVFGKKNLRWREETKEKEGMREKSLTEKYEAQQPRSDVKTEKINKTIPERLSSA